MSYLNIYRHKGEFCFVGNVWPTPEAAAAAATTETEHEPNTVLLRTTNVQTLLRDSQELRQIGALYGVCDPDAGSEAIGDTITSERETLRNALRGLIEAYRLASRVFHEGDDFIFTTDPAVVAATRALAQAEAR